MKNDTTKDINEIINSNPLIKELYEIAKNSPVENVKSATFFLHALNSRNAETNARTTAKEV